MHQIKNLPLTWARVDMSKHIHGHYNSEVSLLDIKEVMSDPPPAKVCYKN